MSRHRLLDDDTAECVCACGCGKPPLPKSRFSRGHHMRTQEQREKTSARKFLGVASRTNGGYMRIGVRFSGPMLEHVLVAERALGKPLPHGAKVHHVNGNKSDNRPENLVICPDQKYHLMLHVREKALTACGHPDWMRCYWCKQYSPQNELYIKNCKSASAIHRACRREMEMDQRARGLRK